MSERRLVILAPTERDLTDPEYMTKYWPNFVHTVRQSLASLDCLVLVAASPRQGDESRRKSRAGAGDR